MKLILLFIIIGVSALQAATAKKPPASYQQFKAEFMNTNVLEQNDLFNFNPQTQRLVGIGSGVGLVGVSGYFLMNDEMKKFGYTALIGGGVYITYIIISSIDKDQNRGSNVPCHWWE